MIQKQGCNFCTRQGLALLPVRPGIKALDDSVPDFPATFTPPPVTAQGETAYTTRLLREGFLYIRNEMAGSWINYYVTQDGFYYPLPESGNVPPAVVNGKTKPCITEPAELARASLITLPVMPSPYENGVFWFAWSEVEWTDAVRKQHEDAGYQTRYMQRFDLNGWLNSGRAENVVSIAALTETVAEHSRGADSCDIRHWSPVYWKKAKALDGTNLFQAAEALSPGKGGMIMLSDPVAVAQELSALSNYRLEVNFTRNPTFSRGLALSSALSGLQNALCSQYERDRLNVADGMEQQVRNGITVKSGALLPSLAETQSNLLYHIDNASLNVQVDVFWAKYEKYIDRSKEKAFIDEYNRQLKAYDQQIISPMVMMYLDWLKSDLLLDYLDHNFDPDNIRSGALFTQTVQYCVQGMQDKSGAGNYFIDQLSQPSVDARNILLRATVLNQTAWTTQISNAVAGHGRYDDIPWDKLGDGFKDITEKMLRDVQSSLEGYLNAMGSSLTAMLNKAGKSLLPAVVALTATYGKALTTVACTGERKHFIRAIVRQLGEMTDLDGRVSASRLRHYVDIEVRRLEAAGMSLEGVHQGSYLVLIDAVEAARLRSSLPEAERAQAAARTLRTADEVSATLFPRWWRNPLALARGGSVGNLANDARQALPFAGCTFSAAFQVFAVSKAAIGLIEGKGRNVEGITKFAANVISAGGALLDAAERAIYKFKSFSLKPLVRLAIGESGLVKLATFLERTAKFCAWFGWVAVGWDAYHFYDETRNKHNYGLGAAYFISFASGGALTAAATLSFVTLGPAGIAIATLFVFGSAIYIAMEGRDDMQKWLAACWWRTIPAGEDDIPDIWLNGRIELEQLNDVLGQGEA
ncbi:T6SS effector BTH_I2691 family protein [Pseudescherichia sp.]|uniref:T6SS effector BTH_I2691 family protein n=1 Tax=Pseudescherichia sp. TaxID=2055881 RepID=UPI00289FA4E2|nr:T6SS effector BTH_I2691 family protein [Pseudescherichia sp.]